MARSKAKKATRIETDSLGPIDVPAGVYWGAQTERSSAFISTSGAT